MRVDLAPWPRSAGAFDPRSSGRAVSRPSGGSGRSEVLVVREDREQIAAEIHTHARQSEGEEPVLAQSLLVGALALLELSQGELDVLPAVALHVR